MAPIYSRAYMLTKVLTANSRELILYLYEGAEGYLDRAIEARKLENDEEAAEMTDRTVSILIELSCSLDYNQNGTLALRLDSIYNFMIEALTKSQGVEGTESLETCRSLISILSDAWRQAVAAEDSQTEPAWEAPIQLSA